MYIWGMAKTENFNRWCKFGKRWVWRYQRPFWERLDTYSKLQVENGVATLLYNLQTPKPIQTTETRKAVSRELQRLFGAGKHLCIIEKSTKSRKGNYYTSHVEYYFKSEGPVDNADQVPDLVEKNLVFEEDF